MRGCDPRGLVEHMTPRARRSAADGVARLFDGIAARRDPFVRRHTGLTRLHDDIGRIHLQFLRRDDGDRGGDALADIDLAGAHMNPAVSIDADPIVDIGVGREAWIGSHRSAPPPVSCLRARRMRGCDPQRHRCGTSASRISASSGLGDFRISAVAAMTRPGVQ